MENQVIKDQTLQGCHYVIIGFRALKLLSGHIESLYFVAINARDVGKITQRTLLSMYCRNMCSVQLRMEINCLSIFIPLKYNPPIFYTAAHHLDFKNTFDLVKIKIKKGFFMLFSEIM